MAKEKKTFYYGTGRRKCAVAKVKLVPGKGNITNKMFMNISHQNYSLWI